jgi:membrane protease YdiL (CAAX protease family)
VLTGVAGTWLPTAQLMLLAILLVLGVVWPVLRPLRRFLVVMIATLALLLLASRVDLPWSTWPVIGGTAFDAKMQAEQIGKVIVTLAMIGVLRILGYRRRDFFLAMGDLRAPIQPARLLGFPGRDPWWRFGLIWSVGIAAALAVAFALSSATAITWSGLMPLLPSVVCYAALNAFNEEMTYRAPMLTTLEPAVGSTQALWLAAVFFGVAHYFGTPGGLTGAALSVFMGWILGKAMVETRGLFWAWWIHFLSDLVIFTFLAAGMVA